MSTEMGPALIGEWSWAVEEGVMNKNTAAGLWAACVQMLGVLDDPDQADVANIDVEGFLTRFQDLHKQRFRPRVLEARRRRFRNAVRSCEECLENPGAWKPANQNRSGGPDRRSWASNASASGGRQHPHRAARTPVDYSPCHIHIYAKYHCSLVDTNK
jgi:hypothetical protein